MNKENKQRIGRLFEKLFVKTYDVKLQPGSGNGKFFKMDAEGKVFLYSLKATANKSWSITKSDLDEVKDATTGPGGTGAIPALVTTLVQEDEPKRGDPIYVTLEFDDLVALMTEDVKAFKPTAQAQAAADSGIPSLFLDK